MDSKRATMTGAQMQLAYMTLLLVGFVAVALLLRSHDVGTLANFRNNPPQIPLKAQPPSLHSLTTAAGMSAASLNSSVSGWHPPNATWITDLGAVINGTGVHGFVFNSSRLPPGVPYGTYNWCNMPHVRASEYPRAPEEYQLEYVEVIHRHHKRTPYASNTFPVESYPWECNDEGLFYSGAPLNPSGHDSARTYWSVLTSPSNPFAPPGFNGSCQFPQITRGGLDDSWQHGRDLWGVYHDLLSFLPSSPFSTTNTTTSPLLEFRVTNNVITSQVASMLIAGMLPSPSPFPLHIQPSSIDSLEPAYPCPAATTLAATYGPGSTTSAPWLAHLAASAPLFAALDAVSGVPAADPAWHRGWDHYFDNLSARLCHAKPLPCSSSGSTCVTQDQADAVFRLGMHEYAHVYRAAPESLPTAVGAYGAWVAELAAHVRDAVAGRARVRYRHNVAHDGSVARVLAVLQAEVMVWPGMGAEVVFEVYSRGAETKAWAVRVLWGGRVLRSSHPQLGRMDMLDVEVLLGYLDGLVGRGAERVPGLCGLA